MSRIIIGPFNRVEGDLEVRLDVADCVVEQARVVSPLYRGFERMLQGKSPLDALVYAPRICGICSVSQSAAAAAALRLMQGVNIPDNGALAVNLMQACENIADHLTHFYLFFMPDFARSVYGKEPWFEWMAPRFKALRGAAVREVLPERAQFMHILGLMAGKWPHTLAIQPGGSTRAVDAREQARLSALVSSFRRFLEARLFGDRLENVAALGSESELDAWTSARSPDSCDFASFLHVSKLLGLNRLGRATDRFLSYGAYGGPRGRLLAQGVFAGGSGSALDIGGITEDVSHSWFQDAGGPRHPFEGQTLPDDSSEPAYSWCKAPRLDGQAYEVGAMARQMVDGQPLIRDIVARSGGSARTRVIARLIEVARVVPAMEDWIRALRPREPFCVQGGPIVQGEAAGLIEAARGALGHWVRVKDGQISSYQIIAPTTWNFSPRDRDGRPGPLELALAGAPVREGEKEPISVQHVVRSFDPCMVCTVH
jgi:Ni,Fe-hydrogenase I large subunit